MPLSELTESERSDIASVRQTIKQSVHYCFLAQSPERYEQTYQLLKKLVAGTYEWSSTAREKNSAEYWVDAFLAFHFKPFQSRSAASTYFNNHWGYLKNLNSDDMSKLRYLQRAYLLYSLSKLSATKIDAMPIISEDTIDADKDWRQDRCNDLKDEWHSILRQQQGMWCRFRLGPQRWHRWHSLAHMRKALVDNLPFAYLVLTLAATRAIGAVAWHWIGDDEANEKLIHNTSYQHAVLALNMITFLVTLVTLTPFFKRSYTEWVAPIGYRLPAPQELLDIYYHGLGSSESSRGDELLPFVGPIPIWPVATAASSSTSLPSPDDTNDATTEQKFKRH